MSSPFLRILFTFVSIHTPSGPMRYTRRWLRTHIHPSELWRIQETTASLTNPPYSENVFELDLVRGIIDKRKIRKVGMVYMKGSSRRKILERQKKSKEVAMAVDTK